MMRSLCQILTVIGLTFNLLVPSKTYAQALFERGFGTPEDDVAAAVCNVDAGGFIAAGYTKGYSPQLIMNPFIVKFDQDGQYVWSTFISTPSGLCVTGIAEDPSGNLVGCASSDFQYWSQTSAQTIESDSILIFKLSPTGTILWQQYVYGSYERKCSELTLAGNGNIIVGGSRVAIGSTKKEATVLVFNSSGVLQNEKVYNSLGDNRFTDLWPTDDGNVLFCSLASDSLFNDYAYIVKTNIAGDSIWTRNYFLTNRPSNRPSSVSSILELNNGHILVGGSTGTASYNKGYLLQLDSTASFNMIPGGGFIIPDGLSHLVHDLAVSPFSNDVTGTHITYNFGSRFSVIHYNYQNFSEGNYYFFNVPVSNFDVHYHMREALAVADHTQGPVASLESFVVGTNRLSAYGKEDFSLLHLVDGYSTINNPAPQISNHTSGFICLGDSALLTLDANGRNFHNWANLLGQSTGVFGDSAQFNLGVPGDSLWVKEEGYYACIAFDADSNIYCSNVIRVQIGIDTIKIDHTLPLAFCAAAGQPDSTVLYVKNMPSWVGPITYQWYTNINSPTPIAGATDSFYVAKTFGYYFCQGTTACGNYETNGMVVRPNATPSQLSAVIPSCNILTNCSAQSFGWFGNDTTSTYTWYDSSATLLSFTGPVYTPGFPTTMYGVAQNACGSDSVTFRAKYRDYLYPDTIAYINCVNGKVLLRIENPKPATTNISWTLNGITIPGAIYDTLWALQAGLYEAHFIDTLCPGQINVQYCNVYPSPSIPPLNITANDTLLCPGEQGTLINIPSIPGAVYTWKLNNVNYFFSNPQIPFATLGGMYMLTITNGCISGYDSIYIFRDSVNVVATANGPTTFCLGDSVQLSTDPSLVSWQWYRRNAVLPGAVSPDFYAHTTGNYYCIAYDSLGCADTSNMITVYVPCIPIGPSEEKSGIFNTSTFEVFPNPTGERVTIKSDPGLFQVYTMLGIQVLEIIISDPEYLLDVSEFAAGNYIFRHQVGDSVFRKIVQVQ
jgi:hypothetical protein